MRSVRPSELSPQELSGYLMGSVGPRPIAFASTIDRNGQRNLSPFSFFNLFGTNPATLIFSPSRRVRDNTVKHTYENVKEVPEVVVGVVTYDMVQQVSLSSTEYGKGVNEFTKSGLTEGKAQLVKPSLIMEAPVQFECKVKDVVSLGDQGGAGNLVICEIQMIHIKESVLNEDGRVDPFKLDLVGRLGGNWYCRANGEALFEVEKPLTKKGMGIDNIPPLIRNSYILSGNDLGKLGNVISPPSPEEVAAYRERSSAVSEIIRNGVDDMERREGLHRLAKEFLEENKVEEAWKTLLSR